MTTRDFAPGCYANLTAKEGESFMGFTVRLAEANRYTDAAEMMWLALQLPHRQAKLHPSRVALEVRASAPLLRLMGRVANGLATSLEHFAAQVLPDESLFFASCRVDADAWLGDSAQVCPECLAENGFAHESWDLAPIACCPTHRTALLDSCLQCRHRLDWKRSFLFRCAKCGADLRRQRSAPATAEACAAADDFAALAPFRLRLDDANTATASWDTTFRVLKGLAAPIECFRRREVMERPFFHQLPATKRLEALEQLGRVRQGDAYDLRRLRPLLLSRLACLDGVPREGISARVAFKLLHSGAGLPREVAAAMTSPEFVTMPASGAAHFKGHPPSIESEAELTEFLGVDAVALEGLVQRRSLPASAAGEPFDIEVLLAARSFLAHELLTPTELAMVAGVAVSSEDFRLSPLVTRWNQASETDLRVELESVCDIQLSLVERMTSCSPPLRPTSVAQLANATDRPFLTLCMLVGLVLSGGLGKASWGAPFTWSSIVLDEQEVAAYSSRHHAAFPFVGRR